MEKQIDKENRKKGAKSEICAFRQRLQKEKDGRQSDTNNRCRKQKFCTANQNRRGNFVWRVILKVDIGANKIALMAQESYKFNITIRENIIFSKEKNRDSLILNTMQKLTALSIVGRLENGLDTRIGASLYDDGIDLSGGETQKIVATRTLLDNADIWIFDEPVAAMDPSSEYSFFNTVLEEDDKSKTMIFVSHRLKIASKMNRIIYLENGKIVGIGTHQQLMTGCEKYRRYYVSWLLMEND